MLDSLLGMAKSVATWPAVALLFVAYFVCSVLFDRRAAALGRENKILDARGWYGPDEVRTLLTALGRGRAACYALSEVTLDLVFPFIYGGLMLALIARVYDDAAARWLILLPVAAAAFDLAENGLIAWLAWRFEGWPAGAAYAAACCTALKFALFLGALLAILVGALGALFLASRS